MHSNLSEQNPHDHTVDLVDRFYRARGGELHVGNIPIGAIAARHGTPVYIYDRNTLDRSWRALRDALPGKFAIYYSMKANPHIAFLDYFLHKDCGIEIASGGELHQAIAAGFSPRDIVFAGPGKTAAELELALTRDIAEIHVESPLEIDRIAAISRKLGLPASIALRVNPAGDAESGAMTMGGRAAPFGIDEENLDAAIDQALKSSELDLTGIHLYTATQILDHNVLLHHYNTAVELARHVARRIGRPLQTLDFGGGLGIPYFAHESELDLHKLSEGVNALVSRLGHDPLFDGTQFIVEPGRFLVGAAGLYVMQVNDIKVSRGKKYLIVDGGMHHHLAASGNFGQTIKRNFPIALLDRMDEPDQETVDIVGPLCTPLDTLARSISLPTAKVGDLIGVFQSGAYARTSSPLGFLSHKTPPEVWIEADKDYLIRPRGTYEEFLRDQWLPGVESSNTCTT